MKIVRNMLYVDYIVESYHYWKLFGETFEIH